jgi:predicted Rdx family selenoprotein
MANEFFSEGGKEVAITMTPGENGVLQVIVEGQKIFDKKEDGGHPNLDRVKQMRTLIKERLTADVAAAD